MISEDSEQNDLSWYGEGRHWKGYINPPIHHLKSRLDNTKQNFENHHYKLKPSFVFLSLRVSCSDLLTCRQ